MEGKAIIVLDVGKTMAKLTLWTAGGALIDRKTRPNDRCTTGPYAALDAHGIELWLCESLSDLARQADIGAVIPVSHGAAVAMVRDGKLACAPLDYEHPIPAEILADYAKLRDPFAKTGSPLLPDGLNLGAQIYWIEQQYPDMAQADVTLMPWAQYWSWLLSGISASEVTSLGCHSDLWNPYGAQPSDLAVARGWADRFAPLQNAGTPLGPITPYWSKKTGLAADVMVHCGLHDSNAALLAARGFREIASRDTTILSTGTWFVAMRSMAQGSAFNPSALAEDRDCLLNVDAYGNVVPSARFMGGREIETLTGVDTRRIDIKPDQPALVAATPKLVADHSMVLPCFAPGFGPFPDATGQWHNKPDDHFALRAAVCLYAAMVASVSLDLIGARDQILVEGRFAEAEVFVRGLASLRPDCAIYVANAHNDVSFGALRLLNPALAPTSTISKVAPLETDLQGYHQAWTDRIGQRGIAA